MGTFDRVWEFMERFGQRRHRYQPGTCAPIDGPQVPPDDVVRNRCKWQLEETLELIEACFGENQRLDDARELIMMVVNHGITRVDLVAYADANADIRYVAYGNDIAAGIYSPDVDAEVCRSNMTKTMPGADGKVRKGPGYEPPKIAEILAEQGWKK